MCSLLESGKGMLKATAGVDAHAPPLSGVLPNILLTWGLVMRNAPNGNLLGRRSAAFCWTPVAIVVVAAVQRGASASFEVENDFHLWCYLI